MNTPAEIAKNYLAIGSAKAKTPVFKCFLLAILAGAYIALAGAGAVFAGSYVSKLAGACVFPAGLAMVIVAGSELFTGNCLLVIPVLDGGIRLRAMIKNLVIVYIGNFVGAMIVVLLTVYGGSFDAVADALVGTAAAKANLTFDDGLFRGIFCNVLVCLGVWMAFGSKTAEGKIICSFLPIMLFVLCGYEHCVANMFFVPAGLLAAAQYGITAEGLTWGSFFVNNLIPVTMGNIIGGAGLGFMYWMIFLRKREK